MQMPNEATVRFEFEEVIYTGTYRDGAVHDTAGTRYDLKSVQLLPPVEPRQVIGIALNYADHAKELGLEIPTVPALFFKPLNTLIGSGTPVVYPNGVQHLHYEAELAVVMNGPARKVGKEDALTFVKGYTLLDDVTARDFVGNFYRPPVKAKGFDTFGPMGPWMVEGLPDIDNTEIRTYVNDELRQQGNTSDFIFTIPELIEYITAFMTLEEDDIILTGTPKGISPVHPGDRIRIEVDHLGSLENGVVAEEPAAVEAEQVTASTDHR